MHSDSCPARPRCCRSRTPRAPRSSCSTSGATLGNNQPVVGIGPLKLGHVAFVVHDPKAHGRILRAGAGLPRLRLDRRFLRVHALQRRSSCGEFHHRQERHDASHRLRAARLGAPAHAPATCSASGKSRSSGDRCGSARPQRRDLPSQPRRLGGRVLCRARPDEGRDARLLRSAAVAPRPAATAEGLGPNEARCGDRRRRRTSSATATDPVSAL